jgi:hypothetical protein
MNMKSKIRMVTAFLVVLVSMTGIAGAMNLKLLGGSNPLVINPGGSMTLDLQANTLGDLAVVNPAHYDLTYTVTGVLGSDPNDVIVTFASGYPGSFNPNTDPYTDFGEVTISLKAVPNSPVDSKFVVKVFAKPSPGSLELETASASRTIQDPISIPEFPKVALPVAAVIGLVIFFQHRKKMEE